MGLITKKDVIRNMASLGDTEADSEIEGRYADYEVQEGGLLDELEDGELRRRSDSE
jgi:hypothetical protein